MPNYFKPILIIFTFIVFIGMQMPAYAQDNPGIPQNESATNPVKKNSKTNVGSDRSECVSQCMSCVEDGLKENAKMIEHFEEAPTFDINHPDNHNNSPNSYTPKFCMSNLQKYCSNKQSPMCMFVFDHNIHKKYCKEQCKDEAFISYLSCQNECANNANAFLGNNPSNEQCTDFCTRTMTDKNLEISGQLDKRIVRKVIRQHQELNACYANKLRKENINNLIVVTWLIDPSGTVTQATIINSTMENKNLENCITDAIKQWRFPAPKDGKPVNVQYTIEFSFTDESAKHNVPKKQNHP